MKRIAVLLPTRNKPEELSRIIKEIGATSTLADLYFYVADDDPKLAEYEHVPLPDHVFGIIGGPQLGFSRAINHLANAALTTMPYDVIMRCEDDFYFERPGWDEAYLAAMPTDLVALVWCNYVLKGPLAEPHTGAIGRRWYETLGYFSLPTLRHYFCDNVLLDLGRAIGRAIYLETPFINHKHNGQDQRKFDEKRDLAPSGIWHTDAPPYKEWREGAAFSSDVHKLQNAIQSYA